MPDIAVEQEAIAAAIPTALLLLHFHASDVTPTQHVQSKPNRDFALIEALTSEVGLVQNIRSYKKWIPLSVVKKSFLSKESDTKILQSIPFPYEVGIISSYSNRIHIWNGFRIHLILND